MSDAVIQIGEQIVEVDVRGGAGPAGVVTPELSALAAAADADRIAAEAAATSAAAYAATVSDLLTIVDTVVFGKPTNPVTGDPLADGSFLLPTPIPITGKVTTVRLWGGTVTGNVTFHRLTKSGTVYTPTGTPLVVSAVANILNTYNPADFNVQAGEYIGYYAASNGPVVALSGGGMFYRLSGDFFPFDTNGATNPAWLLQFNMDIESAPALNPSIFGGSDAILRTTVEAQIGYAAPDEVEIAYGGWTGRVTTGESTSNGANAYPATSLIQPYSNITFTGGPKANPLTGTKPLVEDEVLAGETTVSSSLNHASRLAAAERGIKPADFIQFGFVCGQDGSKVADISKGTAPYTRFLDKLTAAKGLAVAADKDFVVPSIDLIIGLNDSGALTPYATLLPQLNTLRSDMEADIKVTTGQTSPVHFLVIQPSQYALSGGGVGGDPIRAMVGFCRNSRVNHLVAPEYPFPRSDGTHFTAHTAIRIGHYLGRGFNEISKGLPTSALVPLSATADGTALAIRFAVPVGPLVLDAATLGAATDYGIKVVDGTGTLTLSAIAASGNTITATLNRALGSSPKCRIGLDYAPATISSNAGTGTNIRDSSPDTHKVGATTYAMFNWAIADELDIIKLAEAG